jgi:hypothetical protein
MVLKSFDTSRSKGSTVFRCALAVGLLAIAAVPASAITVAVRSGTANGDLGNVNDVDSLYASWTQSAGNTYYGVSIAANLCSNNLSPASASVYLTNSIGAGTTVANQIAATTITTSAPCTGVGATPTTLFTGLTLPPGTYYLVVSNLSGALQWALVHGGATESVGTGVTFNSDEFTTDEPPPYPPADTHFAPVSFGGSSHVFLYSVISTPSANATPTLSNWALAITMILLAGYGLFVMGKLRQQHEL